MENMVQNFFFKLGSGKRMQINSLAIDKSITGSKFRGYSSTYFLLSYMHLVAENEIGWHGKVKV